MPAITLTTDFGTRDWFVGTMKGVIARIAPGSTVVDLTHEVPPGDIWSGAFALWAAVPYFPRGSVHVVVVDPGVGSARAALVVETKMAWFVGPDNGVLSLALRRTKIEAIYRIESPALRLPEVSRTFHGRDVFAPAAAYLACGRAAKSVGQRVRELVQLSWPEPTPVANGWSGEVVFVDRFGNAITNLPETLLSAKPKRAYSLRLGRVHVPFAGSYSGVATGKPLAIVGSTGLIEIAVNGGSAAVKFKLRRGSRVALRQERG